MPISHRYHRNHGKATPKNYLYFCVFRAFCVRLSFAGKGVCILCLTLESQKSQKSYAQRRPLFLCFPCFLCEIISRGKRGLHSLSHVGITEITEKLCPKTTFISVFSVLSV